MFMVKRIDVRLEPFSKQVKIIHNVTKDYTNSQSGLRLIESTSKDVIPEYKSNGDTHLTIRPCCKRSSIVVCFRSELKVVDSK